jgi:hypothetical protein
MEIERITKFVEQLKKVKRIFLDTAPVIYYVEKVRSGTYMQNVQWNR